MPIYHYKCGCGEFTRALPFDRRAEPVGVVCEHCNTSVKRVFGFRMAAVVHEYWNRASDEPFTTRAARDQALSRLSDELSEREGRNVVLEHVDFLDPKVMPKNTDGLEDSVRKAEAEGRTREAEGYRRAISIIESHA